MTTTPPPALIAGAGLAGLVVWEIIARVIAPIAIGTELVPAGLIQAVLGIESETLATVLHGVVGIIAFPLGYILVFRPIMAMLTNKLPWWVLGGIYGVALWVFALYFMAHLIAGYPAFLGFSPLTWVSLIGHVAYAIVMAGVLHWRTA